ncbi:MAG: 4Fe-4S cluster-binding domain-containing protein [Deltaproteobacteria bacterium]|nr:4Fe-4S cluster-binding domain-containing protein [Deltaproteobacteria bacterium]
MTFSAETNKLKNFSVFFRDCKMCPKQCSVNRMETIGFCGQSHLLRIAHIGAHFGEEPPISGSMGSGAIFFSGCSLGCSFCQNHQISTGNLGKPMEFEELFIRVEEMISRTRVHNINFVTPDHFFPYTYRLVSFLQKEGYDLPSVYNLSGYQSIPMLKMTERYADIYLPDYKYSDPKAAKILSNCKNYPDVALYAINEMIKQKGFLDSFKKNSKLATKGVLVRHLILPGLVKNSLNALTSLFLEFGADLPISLMSQYYPVFQHEDKNMNRPLKKEEFDCVYSHAMDLGFKNMFVQIPGNKPFDTELMFLPDFQMDEPFAGNR